VRKKFYKARKTGLPQYWKIFRSSQCNYSKAIVKAKRKSWREFCNNIESASESSRLSRILSQLNRPILGCFKCPNEEYTESMEKFLKPPRNTFPGISRDDILNKPIWSKDRGHIQTQGMVIGCKSGISKGSRISCKDI